MAPDRPRGVLPQSDAWAGEVEPLLLDQIDAAVIALDGGGVISHWNAQAETLYGWSRDDVLGLDVRSLGLLVPASPGEANPLIEGLSAGESRQGEFELRRNDGTPVLAFVKSAPLHAPDGQVIGSTWTSVDATERSAAEFALRRRNAEGTSQDVTEQREAERALRASEQARHRLLAQLVTAQDDERRRLAVDIHDYAIQVLHAAVLRAEALTDLLTTPEQVEAAQPVEDALRSAVANLRRIVAGARLPGLDGVDLVPALEAYLEEVAADWPVRHRLESRVDREPLPEVRAMLFRIVVEAVVNARKHSDANALTVTVESHDSGVRVEVVDDGRGFNPAESGPVDAGHYGLAAMTDRAEMAGGWLRIHSQPGAGTRIEAWIPDRGADR